MKERTVLLRYSYDNLSNPHVFDNIGTGRLLGDGCQFPRDVLFRSLVSEGGYFVLAILITIMSRCYCYGSCLACLITYVTKLLDRALTGTDLRQSRDGVSPEATINTYCGRR